MMVGSRQPSLGIFSALAETTAWQTMGWPNASASKTCCASAIATSTRSSSWRPSASRCIPSTTASVDSSAARFEEVYGVRRGTIDAHYTFFEKVWPNHPELGEEIRARVVADMMSGDRPEI